MFTAGFSFSVQAFRMPLSGGMRVFSDKKYWPHQFSSCSLLTWWVLLRRFPSHRNLASCGLLVSPLLTAEASPWRERLSWLWHLTTEEAQFYSPPVVGYRYWMLQQVKFCCRLWFARRQYRQISKTAVTFGLFTGSRKWLIGLELLEETSYLNSIISAYGDAFQLRELVCRGFIGQLRVILGWGCMVFWVIEWITGTATCWPTHFFCLRRETLLSVE